MTSYPKRYSGVNAPPEILALARQLMSLLLAGEHPTSVALRAQYERSSVASLELTGSGLFIDFSIDPAAPAVDPPDFAGGEVQIELEGCEYPAGCVVFVRGGFLDSLEVYTFVGEWPDRLVVTALRNATPVLPR